MVLEMRSLHFSCSCDLFAQTSDFIGLIVYGYDKQADFRLNGKHCKIGYILIKNANAIKDIKTNMNTMHSRLFTCFFNKEISDDFAGCGFAFQNGQWKFNSYTFNTNADKFHDENKQANPIEKVILHTAMNRIYVNHKWQQNQNLNLNELLQHVTISDMKNFETEAKYKNSDNGRCECGEQLWSSTSSGSS